MRKEADTDMAGVIAISNAILTMGRYKLDISANNLGALVLPEVGLGLESDEVVYNHTDGRQQKRNLACQKVLLLLRCYPHHGRWQS